MRSAIGPLARKVLHLVCDMITVIVPFTELNGVVTSYPDLATGLKLNFTAVWSKPSSWLCKPT